MSNQRERHPLSRSERERRIENLIHLGYIASANDLPEGAIPADTKVPARSWYSLPTPYYAEEIYRCRDCGKETVWTALEQYRYYEVEKGNMYAKRVRCDACYKKKA